MLIAQITGTHIKAGGRLASGKVDAAGALAACVAHLNGLSPRPAFALVPPACRLVTLTDEGRPVGNPSVIGIFRSTGNMGRSSFQSSLLRSTNAPPPRLTSRGIRVASWMTFRPHR